MYFSISSDLDQYIECFRHKQCQKIIKNKRKFIKAIDVSKVHQNHRGIELKIKPSMLSIAIRFVWLTHKVMSYAVRKEIEFSQNFLEYHCCSIKFQTTNSSDFSWPSQLANSPNKDYFHFIYLHRKKRIQRNRNKGTIV